MSSYITYVHYFGYKANLLCAKQNKKGRGGGDAYCSERLTGLMATSAINPNYISNYDLHHNRLATTPFSHLVTSELGQE